jgi:hypothetical protein
MENNLLDTICLEKRVLLNVVKYLQYKDDISIKDLDTVVLKVETEFKRIDEIMSKIKVGDCFFLEDCDGGFEMNWFEQKVIEIIDVKLGIIKCFEPNTFNGHLNPKTMRISEMVTEAEFNIMFLQNENLIKSQSKS